MWNNRYWSRYWADRYWAPVGEDAVFVPYIESGAMNLTIGMGPMGKPSVHPHPLFSRHKQ